MSTGGLSNLSEDKDGLTDGLVVGSEEREPLSKIGPMSLVTALTLLGGVSYAADKVTLSCSNGQEDDYSLPIDLDRVGSIQRGHRA